MSGQASVHKQVSKLRYELQSSQQSGDSSDIFQQKDEEVKLMHFTYVYLPFWLVLKWQYIE